MDNNGETMMPRDDKKASKFLSYVLRHKPETIGIVLDNNGYVEVGAFLEALRTNGWSTFTKDDLDRVVKTNNKKRFAYSSDGLSIRASQGHSIQVDLNLDPQDPPEFLYHGTVDKFLSDIKQEGLNRRSRHDVHLSEDKATATNVGSRRGKPIILTIQAMRMHRAGYSFYKSANGVWLTNEVPSKFIVFPDQ
jgi:putative RNA 2'-phosphotransferase